MYKTVYSDAAKLERYAKANAFTVPGKAVLCRRIAFHLRRCRSHRRLVLLGGDLGWNATLLAGFLPNARITLVDRADGAIKCARAVCGGSRCRFVHGDVRDVRIRWAHYDAVLALFFLHLLPDWQRFLAKVAKNMRKGAVLAVATVTEVQWKANTLGRHLPALQLRRSVDPHDVVEAVKGHGVECLASETVRRADWLRIDDIPVAFSKHSSSFLHRMTRAKLSQLHGMLAGRASGGMLAVRCDCQLLVCLKRR